MRLKINTFLHEFVDAYLLLMLKYHNSASFISSGKQFSRIVELNC